MQKEIKDIINIKIETLFNKPPKKRYDPAFTKDHICWCYLI